jgi:hypothetical protein
MQNINKKWMNKKKKKTTFDVMVSFSFLSRVIGYAFNWLIIGGYAPRTNQIASCFDALSITCID